LICSISLCISFTSHQGVDAVSSTGKEAKFSAQREHGNLPSSLNTPVVALVLTTVEYLVLVLIEQAVTGLQLQLTRLYSVVPSPMVITTGAVIVVSAGMA